jgi:hypothetical protein
MKCLLQMQVAFFFVCIWQPGDCYVVDQTCSCVCNKANSYVRQEVHIYTPLLISNNRMTTVKLNTACWVQEASMHLFLVSQIFVFLEQDMSWILKVLSFASLMYWTISCSFFNSFGFLYHQHSFVDLCFCPIYFSFHFIVFLSPLCHNSRHSSWCCFMFLPLFLPCIIAHFCTW